MTRNTRRRLTKPQASKQTTFQQAHEKGIFAIRRSVAPESYETLQAINNALVPELQNTARLFDVHTLGVTVIGFSRYDKRHRNSGPPTKDIVERVPSSRQKIEVTIGGLATYGSASKGKLGLQLVSTDLANEAHFFEQAFADHDFPLRNDPNCDGILYASHCSLALLYNDTRAHFEDPRSLNKLAELSGLATASSIILEPVHTA